MTAVLHLAREIKRRQLSLCHLLCLLELAHVRRLSFATIYQLHESTGYSLSQITATLAALAEDGLVKFTRAGRGGRCNRSTARLTSEGIALLSTII